MANTELPLNAHNGVTVGAAKYMIADSIGNITPKTITSTGLITSAGQINANANIVSGLITSLNNYSALLLTGEVTSATSATTGGINFGTSGLRKISFDGTTFNVSGNVAVGGTLSTASNFSVTGTIVASGDITAFSDVRTKTNIVTIDNAVNVVKQLRGVTYDRIDNAKHSIGVIAQEVQAVIPQVVTENQDGMLSVAYGNIVGVLIEAIKEQQLQIDELKAIIGAK